MRHASTFATYSGFQQPTCFVPLGKALAGPHSHATSAAYTGSTFRRPTPRQGAALEMLGHAIEYLEDSNFHAARSGDAALGEALYLLRRSSRAVFAESPERVPARKRVVRWLRLHRLNA